CGLCFVRIGVALTMAILSGLGASVAVTMPLVFKGTGLFKDAPGITSPAGLTVLAGVGVVLIGVILASLAGFGRDRELKKLQRTSGGFLVGLIMTIVAGVTSAGIMLAFVYGQGPIVARVSVLEAGKPIKITVVDNAKLTGNYTLSPAGKIALPDVGPIEVRGMTAKAAADKIAGILNLSQQPETDARVRVETQNILAVFAVWSVGLLGGTVVNLCYPLYLMAKNKSWGILVTSWKEVVLAIIIGIQFIVAVALAGKGMLLLGALGASVGAGIQQAMQMIGGQGLGFISGEWRGVHGKPRRQMYLAVAMLIVATIIMACGNALAD
ncbi:MAG: polysaccharide biosynthesis/export family protein, partial [Planctomycetes bacterium]|nr:polysaccharide biosynthesis/export family protein [Planctomycetota bacterium]